ncbi:MAG: FAD-dependent oxidoreductase [Betaproteobacteria bacterium]|jgi:selenide,water dikinase|nr:FAD-dependent oxidoreductase [Betaproteobacteria bacterium]MDH5341334.1 FAD-dependent oxidoreductase [Betaproteobacteria bacterium]
MTRRLLLIGGGHTHVEVIRRWGLSPEPGVTMTLVSPDRHTPYSGMLPGFIAGHYRFEDCHIDLEALCRHAGVAHQECTVESIDITHRRVRCTNGTEQYFDVVSVDTGSTPVTANIPGADRYGTPVKPVAPFLDAWREMQKAARQTAGTLEFAIVGAGAGGIELALAMEHRLRADGGRARISIIGDGSAILPSHPEGVRRRLARILRQRNIVVRLNSPVQEARADRLLLRDGTEVPTDHVLWVTGAAAPEWPRTSGLATDAAGFIAVNEYLQSISHDDVFAAGDVAAMVATPRPKSGVYAVRQGPPLSANLRHALRDEPLVAYRPQNTTLALISTGNRYAIASYGPIAFGGAWVWRWKNRIDTAFMRRYGTAGTAAALQTPG